jgi:hypothetical protein
MDAELEPAPAADPKLTAEALLAVTGIFPDPLKPADGRAASALPKQWRAEVRQFFDQEKPRAFRAPPKVDPAKLQDTVIRGVDADKRAGLVAGLADADLGLAYLDALDHALEVVRAGIPSLTRDTPLGPAQLPLGKVEGMRIASLVAVVNDPARVLEEMQMGTLTTAQAEAFGDVYPSLAERLSSLIWDELVARYKTPEKYALPWAKERVLRTLVGLPPSAPISQAAPPPPKGSTPPTIKVDFQKALATRAQRLAAA